MMRRRALFLDRDGVLLPAVKGKFIHGPDDFNNLLPGVARAIAQAIEANWLVFVVTNQAGVGFGFMDLNDVEEVHDKMLKFISIEGGHVHEIKACYTHPLATVPAFINLNDPRRKPGVGMFTELIRTWDLDPKDCVMVGDTDTDIIPARELGMTTYFIGESEQDDGGADHRRHNLLAVVTHLLRRERRRR